MTTKTPFITVTSSNGVQFAFRLLPVGARYGRGNVLIADKPLVEVYDTRYADDGDDNSVGFGPLGQFVSRYRVETLLERSGGGGIDLFGGIPAWSVDAASMHTVRAWLRMMIALGDVITS